MSKLSPMELLNQVRAKAKLDTKEFEKSIAIKMNKPGKIKLQLLALDSEHLFKSRTQHFIQKLPDTDDPNEKIMVVDCQGENCPICDAAQAFKNSGVTLEQINTAYPSKYPYPKLRNFLTQPEHFLLGVRVLADNAEEGTYLPKDESLGSTQLLQLSKSALSSLMSAYEDFLDEYDDDVEKLPPLFGVFEDNKESVKSLTVNLRVQVQGSWSYIFSFGKAVEVNKSDVDFDKLKLLNETVKPTDDYMENAVKRIHDIQNYFVGNNKSLLTENENNSSIKTDIDSLVDDDDDFNIDTL